MDWDREIKGGVMGDSIVFWGHDELHREGVAIILKKGADRSVLEWKPINSRLIKARLKGKQNNLILIQCYAPTNNSEEDLDNFYLRLQAEIEQVPMQDLIIIIRDLKAKVGVDNSARDRVMGRLES
ncbi:Craniofacial development protein 2, partial [Stylophora pistillata]